MNEIEKSRLEDFKKILTYHLVSKIHHSFKDKYDTYYAAPAIWTKWKNHSIKYDKKIYKLIIAFNQTALSKHQCLHIFGRDTDGKYIAYSKLIAAEESIKTFNKGTICMNGQRFGIKKRYQLPYESIKAIFDDKKLLDKVLDAGSDYYTDRQRRLIFTQINKQLNYHYKTKQEKINEMSDKEKVDALLADFDFSI